MWVTYPGFVGQMVELFRPSTDIKQLTLTYQPDILSGNHLFESQRAILTWKSTCWPL